MDYDLSFSSFGHFFPSAGGKLRFFPGWIWPLSNKGNARFDVFVVINRIECVSFGTGLYELLMSRQDVEYDEGEAPDG